MRLSWTTILDTVDSHFIPDAKGATDIKDVTEPDTKETECPMKLINQ